MRLNRVTEGVLNASVAVASALGALVVVEGALRTAGPESDRYHVLIPGMEREFRPALGLMPGVSGWARYNVNSLGIRGPEFAPGGDEYRILAVGGSTTECLYLGESEVWTTLLQDRLAVATDGRPVVVGNVGRSGLTARDHVVEVKYLLPQLPHIDVVLVLVGVNDLTTTLRQGFRYERPPPITDPDAEELQIRRAFVRIPGKPHEAITSNLLGPDAPWYKRTATWRLRSSARQAWEIRRGSQLQDQGGLAYDTWRFHRASARTRIDSLPILDEALEEYETNLKAIVDLAEQRGTRVVFATQPTLWRPDLAPDEEARLWLGGWVTSSRRRETHTSLPVRSGRA